MVEGKEKCQQSKEDDDDISFDDDDDVSFDDDDYNVSSGIYWFDHHEDPINTSLPGIYWSDHGGLLMLGIYFERN